MSKKQKNNQESAAASENAFEAALGQWRDQHQLNAELLGQMHQRLQAVNAAAHDAGANELSNAAQVLADLLQIAECMGEDESAEAEDVSDILQFVARQWQTVDAHACG
ncbi:MAG: hypothetical protein ACR2NP_19810, partial [Pirellulaceae bacterium]